MTEKLEKTLSLLFLKVKIGQSVVQNWSIEGLDIEIYCTPFNLCPMIPGDSLFNATQCQTATYRPLVGHSDRH